MRRFLFVSCLTLFAISPASADITHKITTSGDSFSYSESYLEGDDVPTVLSTTVTAGVVPALPIFSNTTTTAGGVAGTLAGTIATDGALTITAGGAGTSAVAQVIQELTIK